MSLELCKGIAVIIDDRIVPKKGETADLIVKITDKLRKNNVPFCSYSKLKDARLALDHFRAVNFLILDWDLMGDLDSDQSEDIIKSSHSGKVVSFIKEFRKKCFCPIFIFSNANIADIQDTLTREKLYDETKNNFIYIQSKSELVRGNKLFSLVNKWINRNPTIYTLKNWENAFLFAKNDTFWHLFEKSPLWTKVLWESFDEDSVDPPSNLNDIIYRLVRSRTNLSTLDEKKIKRKGKVDLEEIKEVIQGTMYLSKDRFPEKEFRPGDIFKVRNQEERVDEYFINIRPECDTVIDRESCDGDLYLIKGKRISGGQFKKHHFDKKYGVIHKHNNFLLYGLDGKDFIRFNLKDLTISHHKSILSHRICRLLSPFINDVQQQFSAYVGRFGLPRLPNRVLKQIR